ncbi:Hypothetical protein CINCED_3A015429 [Cinara cedri]|uniref:Uncharacterized protein n=1 Tax=Cinara cedri TaxID=506608 RepID=A0A5E4NP41_9HEMI|nr:Hypothetical protein CINCED_3A015429 [Cinara cedri]
MANMKIYLAIIATFILKHGVYSCSLRSHTLSHSFSDSIATPHHSSVQKLHTIPSPCSNLASDSSSSSSNILPNRSNDIEPVPPLTVLPNSPYVSSSSSNSYNQSLVNILIKLLSSSLESTSMSTTEVTSTFSTPHFVSKPWSSSSSLPYSPVPSSTTVKTVNPGHVSKPNIVTKPCASSSSSSLSSDLSRTSCGLISPSTISLVPLPASSTSASGFNSNLVNVLQKLCSLVSQSTPVSASHPLCSSLLTPTLNTNLKPVTVSKPKTITSYHSAPCSDSSSFSSNTPGLSSGSPSKVKVTETVPLSTFKAIQKTNFENNSPRVTSQTKSVAPLVPVRAPLSTLSTLSEHNSAIINYLIKLLLCTHAPIIVTSFPSTLTLSKLCSLIKPKLNITPDSTLKPETVSSVISTIPPHSSSGPFSSVQPNFLRGSSTKLTLTPVKVTTPLIPISVPTPTFGISSGYNPAFIKLLIKHLLSTPSSLTPHLHPSFKLPQPIINTTPSSPSILNPIPTSTFDGPVSNLNPTVSNILLNKSSVSAPFSTQVPTTIPKKSLSYNQTLINLLFKVLSTASNDNKTPLTVLNSSTSSFFTNFSNSIPISTLAPSSLTKCNSSTSSSFESSVKLSDLSPITAVTLPGDLLPTTVTPSPVLNPFAEQIRDIISPKSFLPPISSSLCHRKHSRLSKLSSSSLSGISPCIKTILRPLAPPLSSLCSKSTFKLSIGCKPPCSN